MRTGLPLFFSSVVLVGWCHHATQAPVALPEALAPILPNARIYYDDGPGFRDSVRMVVRDAVTWQGTWAKATSPQVSPPARPSIDFAKEMVILVGAGRRSPGDQIRVDSAGVRGGVFIVIVRTIVECQSFPADVYPVEIVRVPRTDKPAAFEERRERAPHCT